MKYDFIATPEEIGQANGSPIACCMAKLGISIDPELVTNISVDSIGLNKVRIQITVKG
jgi:hypothetical protein